MFVFLEDITYSQVLPTKVAWDRKADELSEYFTLEKKRKLKQKAVDVNIQQHAMTKFVLIDNWIASLIYIL